MQATQTTGPELVELRRCRGRRCELPAPPELRELKRAAKIREGVGHLNSWRRRLLELTHVEHRVNCGALRQMQFICHRTELGQHLEGAKELEGKLVIGANSNRRLHIGLQFEIDQVTN